MYIWTRSPDGRPGGSMWEIIDRLKAVKASILRVMQRRLRAGLHRRRAAAALVNMSRARNIRGWHCMRLYVWVWSAVIDSYKPQVSIQTIQTCTSCDDASVCTMGQVIDSHCVITLDARYDIAPFRDGPRMQHPGLATVCSLSLPPSRFGTIISRVASATVS
jgi:hypothetical protein